MVRVPSAAMGGQDFYVQEPCLIQRSFNDVAPVIPIRWFTRRGKLFGQFHHLEVEEGVYMMGNHFEAPIDQLLLSYPLFLRNHHHYKLPSPTQVKGNHSLQCHLNIDRTAFRIQLWRSWKHLAGKSPRESVSNTPSLDLLRRHIGQHF